MSTHRQTRLWKATLPADLEAIPAELRALPRWMPWDYFDKGKKKPAKVTMVRHGDYGADSTSPAEWRTFDQAVEEARRRRCGIGFVFSEDDDLCGVDLDSAYDESGKLKPWAAEIAERFSSTWAEKSPSGRGIHFIGRGDKVAGSTKVDHKDRKEFSEGEAVERYSQKRWFTFSGNVLNAVPVADMRDAMAWLDERFFSTATKPKRAPDSQPAAAPRDAWDDDHELDVQLGRLCLGYLRPDTAANGDEWRRAGMAAKAVGEELKEPWFQFSRLWPEYDDAELEDRWSRFAPASLELGTLIWMATRDSGRSAIDLTNEARRNLGREESRREHAPIGCTNEETVEAALAAAIPAPAVEPAAPDRVAGLTWQRAGRPDGMVARVSLSRDGLLVDLAEINLGDREKREHYAVRAADLLGAGVTVAAVKAELLRAAAARAAPVVEAQADEPASDAASVSTRWREQDGERLVATGFPAIDHRFGGGLSPGITAICAMPGRGKSALAGQLMLGALNAAPNLRAVWFRGEMTDFLLWSRFLATWSAIRSPAVPAITRRMASKQDATARKVDADLVRVVGGRLNIVPGPLTPERIMAAIEKHRPGMIVVDYLQRTRAAGFQDRRMEIDHVLGVVSDLTTAHDLATIVVSSMAGSRSSDTDIGSLTKESNRLDFDAHSYLALWGDKKEKDKDPRPMRLEIVKGRTGGEGTVDLWFSGSGQHFTQQADQHLEPDAPATYNADFDAWPMEARS